MEVSGSSSGGEKGSRALSVMEALVAEAVIFAGNSLAFFLLLTGYLLSGADRSTKLSALSESFPFDELCKVKRPVPENKDAGDLDDEDDDEDVDNAAEDDDGNDEDFSADEAGDDDDDDGEDDNDDGDDDDGEDEEDDDDDDNHLAQSIRDAASARTAALLTIEEKKLKFEQIKWEFERDEREARRKEDLEEERRKRNVQIAERAKERKFALMQTMISGGKDLEEIKYMLSLMD